MKKIIQYISYFMAVIGFATVIWGAAVIYERKENKTSTIEKKVDKLIISDSVKSIKLDEIINTQYIFNRKLENNTNSQIALKENFIKYLSKQPITNEEFLQYMRGLTFNVNDLKKN